MKTSLLQWNNFELLSIGMCSKLILKHAKRSFVLITPIITLVNTIAHCPNLIELELYQNFSERSKLRNVNYYCAIRRTI